MLKKYTLYLFILFSLSYLGVKAQDCFITITQPANDTTICFGDSVYLKSEGSCNIFLNGGFENGLGPGWTSSYPDPIYIDQGCDDEYFPAGLGPNENYGWFGPTGQMVQPRHITTDTFDIPFGGDCNVKFWMRYGRAEHAGNSDCEDPNNPDNGLHLQYSTDFGTTWFDFPGVNQYPIGQNKADPPFQTLIPGSGGYWQPTQENPIGGFHVPERYDTSAVYWWHQYSCEIPPAAMTNQTMFRFMQDFHQSAKSDTWGIDEVLLWCADNQNVFWSHGPTVFNPIDPVSPTVTTDYIVTVYDSLGNFATDTVTITVIPIPDPDLGPDTAICDYGVNTAYFDAGPGFEHYLWNTGDTTQVITPNVTGWYSVIATTYNCTGGDSVYLQMVPLVYADAGSDEITCEETPFDLSNSSIPPIATDYNSVLWYGGLGTFDDPTAIAPIYTPAPGETGQVVLTMVAYGNAPCGNDTSRMILNVIIIPDPNLGPDTTICDNGINSAYFDAGSGYEHYLWNTGDTIQVITPNTTGWYSVTATNAICTGVDSVFLQMIPQVYADAGSDEITCEETPFDLSNSSIPPTATDYNSILWYGGLGTFDDPTAITPIYTPAPGETGQVVLTMLAYGNAPCGNDTSQMILDVFPNAIANAGSNESTCRGEPFNFATSSIVPSASNYDTLYWIGGAGNFIDPYAVIPVYVPDPAELGQITLTMVTSGLISNCDSVDEMILTIYPDYLTLIDTTICFLDSLYAQGSWQNTSGVYFDTLQTINACDSVIQTNLTVRPEINYDFIPDPQSVCLGEVMSFFQSGSSVITDFLWDFGDGQTSTQSDPTHIYNATGIYNVSLNYTDDNGCSDMKIHPVEVMLQAEVDFTSSGPVACLYEALSFNGFSNFNIVLWDWDFGDGQTGSGQNVSHSYNLPGTYTVSLTGWTISGCEGTITHSIYIPPSPVADFAYYVVYCDSLQFTDLSYHPSGYNIVEWDWDFGDGVSSVLQHPWHVYDSGGVYMVTLIATSDSAGLLCSDTITKPVSVPGRPTVYFTWDRDPTCFGNTTSFFGTSGGNIVSWYWDFGDGTSGTGQEPVHLFTSIDTFDVVLTVTDVNGCPRSLMHPVVVIDLPDIDFTVTPNPTCRDNLTSFEGISNANVNNWIWDFGDGSTGVGQYTSHRYLQTGTFNVSVTIDDTTGCPNSIIHPVVVNNPPTADFGFNATTCSNDTVYFTDYSSTPNGYMLQWDWDLGDGTIITVQYPDDPDIAYVYPMGGSYTVTLTVLDSDSCSHAYSRVIEIESSPIANFNHPPACNGTAVEFTDLSSINGGSPIITWYWEFDDPNSGSNTSTQQDPAHIFSSSGTYNVTLVVNNIVNCSDTIIKTVAVNDLPGVDFNKSSDTSCINHEVIFTSLSQAIYSHWWDFGDGGTSVQLNPVHVYQDPGTYYISLTVVDEFGCTNTITDSIVIDPPPWAAYNYSAPTCNGMPILFTDESSAYSGYIAQWHWYFGDGNDTIVMYPDDPDITHSYDNPGVYFSSLVITSSSGCKDSTNRVMNIGQGPVALFDHSGNNCAGAMMEFYDLSYAFGIEIISWQWDFGDPSSGVNNTSNLQNPTHVFDVSGTYTVTLQATMVGGCYNVVTQEITIEPAPLAYFYTDPPSGCFGDLTHFYTDPDSTNIAEVVNYLWEFDDPASGANNLSILQNPTHLFTLPGDYNVSLTITDIYDCQNTVVRQINIGEKPLADFSFEKPCIGDSTQFLDGSISGGAIITHWDWDFGDPATAPHNTSSLQNPGHLYSAIGIYEVRLIVTDINGCMDTVYKEIQIDDSPTSAFNFNNQCIPPGTVFFTDLSWPGSSNQPIVDWLWEFEPGVFSSLASPQHTFDKTDTSYQVSLTVTDQIGCEQTSSREVFVMGLPTIAIVSNDVCFGERTLFHAIYQASNDTVKQWIWNFNDGSPIVHTEYDTISHLYLMAGNYMPKVTAINIADCEFTTHEEINVHPLPVPDFSSTIATCNDPTEFTDLSTAPGSSIATWEWDFGDGESSNYQSPVHSYGIQDSTYLATLTVTNAFGCVEALQKDVIKGACLIAAFAPNLQSPCNNLAACFIDGSMLYSSEYPIIRWDWDFGDGTTETYGYFQDTVCHYYLNTGMYNVKLAVTALINGMEQRDSTSRNIQFALSPSADFTISKPCINNSTLFTDMTMGNGTIITSWDWDFGDMYSSNDTSSIQHPTYNYAIPGLYNIKLVTTNNLGCSDTIDKEVEIFSSPIVDFTHTISCAGKKTSFKDEAATVHSPIYNWSWYFGDMHSTTDSSNLQNPEYIYKHEGEYIVVLKVTDANLCEDIISKVIEVNPTPVSYFNTISNYDGIYGKVLCENLSVGAIQYMWDFDNGETSEIENPQVVYEDPGKYIIQLVVLNEYQCYDTSYKELEITIQGLFVPNAFIPEGDNPDLQLFKPVGINLRKYKIEIFNRWGFVIWSSMKLDSEGSPAEGWDGTLGGKPLPIGDYVWKIEAEFKTGQPWQGSDVGDGNEKTYGTVTLIR